LTLLIPALVACGGVRAQDEGGEAQAQAAQADFARSVRTLRAQEGTLRVTRSASATVEPAQESQVSAGTTGQVEAVLAREGSRVEAGETVLQLGDESLRLGLDNARLALETARVNLRSAERSSTGNVQQAEAALQAAETSLEIARGQLEEGRQLYAAGGIPKTQLDQLQVGLEQAESAFLQAQAAADASRRAPEEDLELLRLQVRQAETQLDQAEQALADARLTAPFAGEIAEMLVAEGEFIGAGSPAFRLRSTQRQLVRFSVPPEDADALLAQGTLWIPYEGLDYAAQVVRTAQTDGSRLVEVVAELYPSETRIPTGTVTGFSYELDLASGVLLPTGAVRTSGGRTSVLVVQGGRAEAREVQIRAESGTQVVVSGIDPGTQVVYPLPADLAPGTPVEVVGE